MKGYKFILVSIFSLLLVGVFTTSTFAANWSSLVTATRVGSKGSGKTSSNYVVKRTSVARGSVSGYQITQWLSPSAGIVNSNGIARSNLRYLASGVDLDLTLYEDAWKGYHYYGKAYSHNWEPDITTIRYYFSPDPA